jgi:hypothetical protein
MNSSKETTLTELAREADSREADKFLAELLNLSDQQKALGRFRKRYGHWFPRHVSALDDVVVEVAGDERAGVLSSVLPYRDILRIAWIQPTTLARELDVLGAIYKYGHAKGANTLPRDPFILALLRAQHQVDRMRHCLNVQCPAPYFLALRRSQRYCSEECARPAQREFKRTWWANHGEQWRAKKAGKRG